MKATKNGIKCRQLHREGHPQKVSAEQREHVEAHDSQRIAENNLIDSHFEKQNLLESILSKGNMERAVERVRKNKGAAGIDGMGVHELESHLEENWSELRRRILGGGYKPQAVRRVEIPKERKGEVRKLGIPTVVDRVIQQAIAQKLTPLYEPQFDDNSFGFRPNRGAYDALRRCQQNVSDGYTYVLDMDLEKYFDTVNHSKLIQLLSETVKDGRVISLIHRYLRAGVVVKQVFEETEVGTPQGGPLSPLLSNIYLNELDRELRRRNHRFVRYADDMVIFCRSLKAAERTLRHIQPFIEGALLLRVNEEKTTVGHILGIKFLGYAFYLYKGVARLKVHPRSLAKLKAGIKELTGRSKGWSHEVRRKKLNAKVRGWVNYFRLADMKNFLKELDGYYRRRLRMVYWKCWKKIKTKRQYLMKLGMSKSEAEKFSNTRKGYWRIAGSPILSKSLSNQKLRVIGYLFFYDYYLEKTVN
jgi:group II intron reverse transcriptase/maturase